MVERRPSIRRVPGAILGLEPFLRIAADGGTCQIPRYHFTANYFSQREIDGEYKTGWVYVTRILLS